MCRPDNPLIIDPPVIDQAVQPASVELTLDDTIEIAWGTPRNPDGKQKLSITDNYGDDGYPMMPDQFLLASTVQEVWMPDDLVAQVNGKSSLGRLGLAVHITAGFIDPGFRGTVTLELKNVSHCVIKLRPGMPICQLVFFQMTSPAERPYGTPGLDSHYMDQVGVTGSRL
jgi:dCTP deaminase